MFVITSSLRLWNEGNDDLSRKLLLSLTLRSRMILMKCEREFSIIIISFKSMSMVDKCWIISSVMGG